VAIYIYIYSGTAAPMYICSKNFSEGAWLSDFSGWPHFHTAMTRSSRCRVRRISSCDPQILQPCVTRQLSLSPRTGCGIHYVQQSTTCTCAWLVMSCQVCLAPAALGLSCRAKFAWRAICKNVRHVACRSHFGLLLHVPLSLAEGATVDTRR